LSILTVSAVLLLTGFIRNLKLIFLGGDYTGRLYTTIEVNLLVAVSLALYLGIKRRWLVAVAAIALAFAWLALGSINSVV
jgi:hypothetical protein